MNEQELKKLTDEIIEGRRLGPRDQLDFLQYSDRKLLSMYADRLREHFSGAHTDLCAVINGKSGKCGENCKFCAQSAHHHTSCDVHPLLSVKEILEAAIEHEREGVNRFAVVTSGRGPSADDFEKILEIYRTLKEKTGIGLCASLGFLTAEEFRRLHEAGVTRYHNNLETGRYFFPMICTTHTFDDKVANIRRAQAAGLSVCSGGIIGMGETFRDRMDMALTLEELGIRSIPINVLTPIPGTPLAHLEALSADEILRTVAMFRFINPEADIRLAAGRKLLGGGGISAFRGGASAAITGNMLTTTGMTTRQDREMLKEAGRL